MPRFGVAGYPPAFGLSPFGKDRMKICHWLQSLDLGALELQMTYGPRTSMENCREYRRVAEDCGIKLSVHASYFIVFTSQEPDKLANSKDTLKRTFELCDILGADVAVVHPGPLYGNKDSAPILERFIDNLGQAMTEIGNTNIGLFVETAGKVGQLGSVDDVLTISDQLPGVYPCVDFGHVHARTLGSLGSEDAINALFQKLASHNCFEPDRRIHFHYTPIHYGPRGEISHKAINDRQESASQVQEELFAQAAISASDLYYPRFEPVAKGLRDWNVECTIISETNDSQEEGALALKATFNSL